jgi:hypothetical protein
MRVVTMTQTYPKARRELEYTLMAYFYSPCFEHMKFLGLGIGIKLTEAAVGKIWETAQYYSFKDPGVTFSVTIVEDVGERLVLTSLDSAFEAIICS